MARYSAWVAIFSFFLALESTSAFVYRVGGKKGWEVPPGCESYNHWAGSHRFQIGDSLLFNYAQGSSVLVVTEEAYSTCNTTNPILYSTNGDSLFRFKRSGPFYFIGGFGENCSKGQKLVIVVMAQRDSSLGWTVGNHSPLADSPAYRHPLNTAAGFAVSSRPGLVFSSFTAIAFKLIFL